MEISGIKEYYFPTVCGRWDNGGDLFLCMNSCMGARMYISVYVQCMLVYMHACTCVRLANDFINVKTETKLLICCEEIPTFHRQARFLLRLQILRSFGTARAVLSNRAPHAKFIGGLSLLPILRVITKIPHSQKNSHLLVIYPKIYSHF